MMLIIKKSAIVYMGLGLNALSTPTYHKLTSNYLNSITIVATDDNSTSTTVYGGLATNITFGIFFMWLIILMKIIFLNSI